MRESALTLLVASGDDGMELEVLVGDAAAVVAALKSGSADATREMVGGDVQVSS